MTELTTNERRWLVGDRTGAGRKAVDIIEAQAAALERVRRLERQRASDGWDQPLTDALGSAKGPRPISYATLTPVLARAASGRDPSQVCDECGATHGPGNTNTLCPLASNYRAPAQAAEPIPVVSLHLHEARVRELEDKLALTTSLEPTGILEARAMQAERRVAELEAELASSRAKYDLFKAASLARVAELEAARAPSTLETLTRALSRSAEKNLQLTAQNDEQASTITKHQERVAELETSVATRETWIRLAQEVLRGE